ncbi:MAG: Glu/Leu/Phe/Val dehydrogenase [Dehalococcoidia bacterium]|nr:Glu/Leu/Phe/Val dehydrogenase [Dehalococcoidia bacterium]
MNVLEYMERYGHEQFSVYTDASVGLKAFIAIHDTTLGPALGGVRVWPHPTEDAAVMDVLRLSRAMTYKSAAAGLNFGGGKGLIMADSRKDKSEALMRAFGRFVESLGGRYITTEDVGITLHDLEQIAQETSHVTGLPISLGGSGDTSSMTGFGVYQGMRACAKEAWGSDSLAGRTIAIQGFGHTATALVENILKKEEGVKFIVADINEESLARARQYPGVQIVGPDDIFSAACDIFAPCALGGILNSNTIPRLRCRIVCGSANNQLLELEDADAIQKRGIVYAPDYIVNAGGVINISCEVGTNYSEDASREKTARIYETIQRVIAISKKQGISTARAADHLAEERIAAVRKIRRVYL